MATLAAPVKTQLGLDELRGRARTLGQRHRTVLLLVDGRRALSEVLSLAQQAGAQTSHFEDLVRMGMVELPQGAMAPDPRDSSPSVFDQPRVTSVELDVPAAGSQSESPAAALNASSTPPSDLPKAAESQSSREMPVAESSARPLGPDGPMKPVALAAVPKPPAEAKRSLEIDASSNAQADPEVATPAVKPALSPHSAAPAASLQTRQTPLAAGARPAVDPAPQAAALVPRQRGVERAAVTSQAVAPTGASPPPPNGTEQRTPAAAARRSNPTGAPAVQAPVTRGARTADSALSRAVASQPIAPRSRPTPPKASDRQSDPARTVPTLPIGTAAPAPPAARSSIRRSVLGRLAAPRAGSIRVPADPAEQRLERVRELLVETLRIDAPLFGVRMLMRLRSAVGIDDLIELVWDIERHLIAARHSRDEMLSLQRARELLGLGNTVVADDD